MKQLFYFLIPLFMAVLIAGCSSSKRSYERGEGYTSEEGGMIRVLLNEQGSGYNWRIESPVYLKENGKSLALINPGNFLLISNSDGELNINIEGRSYNGNRFMLSSAEPDSPLDYNGSSYHGELEIIPDGNDLSIVNILSIEQYLKGVIPHEMPLGTGTEYYEALKAFSICARTYTISKINENKNIFDVFPDTRDQVYGGARLENDAMNKIVDDTRGLILTYDAKPAITLYHSTCGGYTEDAKNVFTKISAPYLESIKDGTEPYCSISPKFTWTEKYDENTFVARFVSAGYLNNNNYSVSYVNANSYFKSGRINELEVDFVNTLNETKTVKIYGNDIRYVIRTANNKSILESNNFNIIKEKDKIILNGRGYGHGVGLCQWGALEQSKEGISYKDILSFYYPGTKIENYSQM